MKKIIIMIFLILIAPHTSAISFNSNNQSIMERVNQCEGPVNVKTIPYNEHRFEDFIVERCIRNGTYLWECQCNQEFVLEFLPPEDYEGVLNIVFQYYTDYKSVDQPDNNSSTPSINEVFNENNKVVKRYDNVTFYVADGGLASNLLKKGDFGILNNVIILLFFIFIMAIFVVRKKFFKGGFKEKNDPFNFESGDDSDVEDFFK